jgi:hypothetical protein
MSNAVLVTAHEAADGIDAWEWARSNPYLAPDGQGGVFVTYRGAVPYPFPQYLEHFDRQGRRLLGSRDAPYVVCPAALKPGLGVMVADGASGVFMSVWLEEPRTGIRRSQIQRLGPDGTPLWASTEFGINVTTSDNPPAADSVGGDVALRLMPIGDGGVAVYFHLYGTQGTLLQVFDAEGNRRWPEGWLAFTPPEGEPDSPYYVVQDGDGDGGFWKYSKTRGAADGTHVPPLTLFAQRYVPGGGTAFSPPGVTVADGIFSVHACARTWPDGRGGYLVLYDSHLETFDMQDQSWTAALFVARVAPGGDLLWDAGVPLTTTMGYVYRLAAPNPGEAEGVPDGRGGVFAGWPEDRDGDGQKECYGQYVAPDGTLAGPTDGARLTGGAELLCSAMFTSMLTYLAQTTDGDAVFTSLEQDQTVWQGPWRLTFQKLHQDLTARWGPGGAVAMACDPALSPDHGLCSGAVLDQVEGVVPDAEGGVYAAWSTCDLLWIIHITADGQVDWTP